MLTHTLTDKKAEHQIEVNRNLALEGQLEKSQQNEKKLESLVADFQSSLVGLYEVAQRMESFVGHVGMQMENSFRKLAVLSQRINFASGRVQFLQGLCTVEKLQSVFYSCTSDWTLNLFLSNIRNTIMIMKLFSYICCSLTFFVRFTNTPRGPVEK